MVGRFNAPKKQLTVSDCVFPKLELTIRADDQVWHSFSILRADGFEVTELPTTLNWRHISITLITRRSSLRIPLDCFT